MHMHRVKGQRVHPEEFLFKCPSFLFGFTVKLTQYRNQNSPRLLRTDAHSMLLVSNAYYSIVNLYPEPPACKSKRSRKLKPESGRFGSGKHLQGTLTPYSHCSGVPCTTLWLFETRSSRFDLQGGAGYKLTREY